MMSSLALSDAMLAFASIFAVFLMAQQKALAQVHRLSGVMALLGFLLMAMAATLGCLRYGFSSAWAGPHDMMTNIATFMSPPLVSIALYLGLSAKCWSKAAWGRVIIVVCLLYEVSRWYRLESLYRDLQLGLALAATLYFILKSQLDYGPKLMMLTALASYFVGGLIIGNQGTLLGYLRLDLFRYFIGLGNLLLSSGMYLALSHSYPQPEH